jgi:N-methylhydantoinase B
VRSGQPPERISHGVVALEPGDRLEVSSGGGGGFGPAAERDPALIEADLKAGYVSAEAVRDLYKRG